MSRCFPFPPPGYEKEARTCDLDLLKKEKDKERKLKKEKKNKEKREGKDKEKEKDRSDAKHGDKKEKKEKHKDKKEKDRAKDKEKSSTSNEKRLPKEIEHINGNKASDAKKLTGKPEVTSGEIFVQKGKEKILDRNNISGEGKFSGQFSGYSERVSQNSHFSELPEDPKFVQLVDKRIEDEARGAGKQLVEKFTGGDARKDEGMVRLVAKSAGASVDGKEKNKKSNDRKLDGQGIKDGARFTANAMSPSIPGVVQPRIDRTSKSPLEKDGDKRIEGKEKGKQKEKEGHGKGKNRDKEKKQEEKAKEKSEHKKTEPDKLKESCKDGLTGIYNAKTTQVPEESIKNPVQGNLKKRKDSDANGFLNACDIKPAKVPKPTSLPLTQNGKILGIPQNSSPVISVRQGALNNLKADAKENKINGIIEAPAVSISSTTPPSSIPAKPLPTNAKADQIAEPSRKLPHPDSKYLREVLTVPKMEQWSDFDDQEWLFKGSDSQSKKPLVDAFEIDEISQVWSEALRIESADVCALPYVIPY